jgi:hypothetical protein
MSFLYTVQSNTMNRSHTRPSSMSLLCQSELFAIFGTKCICAYLHNYFCCVIPTALQILHTYQTDSKLCRHVHNFVCRNTSHINKCLHTYTHIDPTRVVTSPYRHRTRSYSLVCHIFSSTALHTHQIDPRTPCYRCFVTDASLFVVGLADMFIDCCSSYTCVSVLNRPL